MHLEFVVLGVPISNQSSGSAALRAWREAVATAAKANWPDEPLTGELRATVINFYIGATPSLDLDNMSKPILDVMRRIVYGDDRQIRQAELAHVPIDDPFVIVGSSKLITNSLQVGVEFVYVRIEDTITPYPLPK